MTVKNTEWCVAVSYSYFSNYIML